MNFKKQKHQDSLSRPSIGGDLCSQVISKGSCGLSKLHYRSWNKMPKNNTCFSSKIKQSQNIHFSDLQKQYWVWSPKINCEAKLQQDEIQSIYCFWPQICTLQNLYDSCQEWWRWWINLKTKFGSAVLPSYCNEFDNNFSKQKFHSKICEENKMRNDYYEEKKEVIVANHQTHASIKSCDLQNAKIEQLIDLSSEKSTKKLTNNLKFRNDVVFKTILRCFRKHYIKDFKSFFDYQKNRNQSELFVSKVRKYLIKLFGYESETLRTVFICIIDTKQKYFQVSEDQEHFLLMINDLMYNFNADKMAELIDIVEFSKILKLFLVQDNIINIVLKNRNDSSLTDTYRKQINYLICLCTKN